MSESKREEERAAPAKREEERAAPAKREEEPTAPAKREEEPTAPAKREEEPASTAREEQGRIDIQPLLMELRILYASMDLGSTDKCECPLRRPFKLNQIKRHLRMDTLQNFDVLVFTRLADAGVRQYITECGFAEAASSEDESQVRIYVRQGLDVANVHRYPRSATATVIKNDACTTITGVHWAHENDRLTRERQYTFEATFGNDEDPKKSRWVIVGGFNRPLHIILNTFHRELQVLGTADQPLPKTNENYQIKPPTIEGTDTYYEGVPTSATQRPHVVDHVFASPLFRNEPPQEDGQYTWRCAVIDRPDLYMRATEDDDTEYCFNHPMLEVQIPLIDIPNQQPQATALTDAPQATAPTDGPQATAPTDGPSGGTQPTSSVAKPKK